jgi:hypothetical protein
MDHATKDKLSRALLASLFFCLNSPQTRPPILNPNTKNRMQPRLAGVQELFLQKNKIQEGALRHVCCCGRDAAMKKLKSSLGEEGRQLGLTALSGGVVCCLLLLLRCPFTRP